MLHAFTKPINHIALPERFTFPFHYTPHPLCIMATEEVRRYIQTQTQWSDELAKGKMFGVLIVRNNTGEIGFLAAFSGNLAGSNNHPYFVPAVFDLLNPQGFFKQEEAVISKINLIVRQLEKNPAYLQSQQKLSAATSKASIALAEAKSALKEHKEIREKRRQNNPDSAERESMIRESQYEKAEYNRLKRFWQTESETLQAEVNRFKIEIEDLKTRRKTLSAALQQKLFDCFQMLNIRGEAKGLPEIFAQTAQKTPPAGAGECAGPKLLQYAFLNQFEPLAMAEFWWGDSPKTEIRQHGQYYPACKGKCEPILGHMLQGLEIDPNPLFNNQTHNTELEILFEDEWLLVVNKPHGMLSVPGKSSADSVYTRILARYPQATGPLIVHRLDMATSGLLLIAKTKEVHKELQAQFKNRTVKKRYQALLEGSVSETEGIINLPLCLNPLDRPRQMVSTEYGKTAITHWTVLKKDPTHTRVVFYPLTGRTHQLRMHAAHILGIGNPIIGDELYGKKAERMYLHAEYLEFEHPVTGKQICVEKEADF